MRRGVAGIVCGMVALCLVGGVHPLAAQRTQAPRKPVPASGGAAGRVAYVDQRQIYAQTAGYAAAESTFTKEVQGYRGEVQKMQAQFDSAGSKLDQESVVLSPTQKQARQKELQDLREKLEARTQELQQKAATRERELLAPIQQRVFTVIEDMRAEGNYAMIFDVGAQGSGLLTADKSLDLTARVIERMKSANK